MPAERLARILAMFGASDETTPAPSLCAVCATATHMTGAGIMLMSGDLPRGSVCSSNATSAALEELQFLLGEGPCVDAYNLDRPVLEPDLGSRQPQRWLEFSRGALAAGAQAVFGFPMQVGAVRLGALNLYRDRPGPMSDDEHADALVAAGIAARDVLAKQANASPGTLAPELEATGNFRFVVHQATGMVAAQLDVNVSEAMIRLRAHAFADDRPLIDVAHDIVNRQLRLA